MVQQSESIERERKRGRKKGGGDGEKEGERKREGVERYTHQMCSGQYQTLFILGTAL